MEDSASNLDSLSCCIEADIIYDWVSKDICVKPIIYEGYQGLKSLQLDCDKYISESDNTIFTECYICDCNGTIVNSNDIPLNEKNSQIYLRDPNTLTGSQSSLEKTLILVEGFFKILLYNSKQQYCISCPQPFKTVQNIDLYRPKGSSISCILKNVDCIAEVICEESFCGERLFKEIKVEICFKLDVQIYKNGTIEMIAGEKLLPFLGKSDF